MGHLILRVTIKLLFAPIILYAFYVQFHGDYGPGGGFQAGVILASAFILHALGFGLDRCQKVIPPSWLPVGMALGVLIYAGTGVYTMLLGGNFLEYEMLAPLLRVSAVEAHSLGILFVEVGVAMTVMATMILIYNYISSLGTYERGL